MPRLAGLATAIPPFAVDQEDVIARAERLFPTAKGESFISFVLNSGVHRRYCSVPLDWFEHSHGWRERNGRYLETAVTLLESAARKAIDRAGLSETEIGAVVAVSSTGIAIPGLDALLIERMRLPQCIQRLPIFGLGCAGGVIGLARAATLARTIPDKAVLFLVVELCSLTFRRDDTSKSNFVAASLFGDGAAAALIRCYGSGPAIVAAGEHTWRQSLDFMRLDVADDALKPTFSRDIPRLVDEKLLPLAREFLSRHGLVVRDIDRFVCHPGGPKVIDACERAFKITPGTLIDSRQVLQEYGNMSAATVLFVLESMLSRTAASRDDWKHALMTALGPGFTAGFLLLENSLAAPEAAELPRSKPQ